MLQDLLEPLLQLTFSSWVEYGCIDAVVVGTEVDSVEATVGAIEEPQAVTVGGLDFCS